MSEPTLSERLKELDAAATKGPWKTRAESGVSWQGKPWTEVHVEPLGLDDSETGHSIVEDGDAYLIVALRNALPAIAAFAEAADALRQRAETHANLLACYRVGRAPSDRLLNYLNKTADAPMNFDTTRAALVAALAGGTR